MLTERTIEGKSAIFELPCFKMWFEDGILFFVYASKINIDLEIAKHCVQHRIDFSKGVSYPVLINLKGVKSVTREAREYLADEGIRLIKAGALHTNSPLTKILGNAFLIINKPKVATRLFTDEMEAVAWLRKFI